MSALPFDTRKAISSLTDAGFPVLQAEAIASGIVIAATGMLVRF